MLERPRRAPVKSPFIVYSLLQSAHKVKAIWEGIVVSFESGAKTSSGVGVSCTHPFKPSRASFLVPPRNPKTAGGGRAQLCGAGARSR